ISPQDVGTLERSTRRTIQAIADVRARQTSHGRPSIEVAYRAPQTETERTLASIWTEVLGIDAVGVDDPYGALGGDSLMAVRLMSRIRRDLNVALPVRAVYDVPTVARLAERVDAIRWARAGLSVDSGSADVETGV